MGRRSRSEAHAVSTPATVALTAAGITFTVHPYEHDPHAESYGAEAAQALGVEPGQVFKTLLAEGDDGMVVGVVPVTARLDLKGLARAVGSKRLSMADPARAERSTGYVVGGISPVGQKRPLPTVLDASAQAWDRVYVSGGRRGFDIALSPQDLLMVTDGVYGPIAR